MPIIPLLVLLLLIVLLFQPGAFTPAVMQALQIIVLVLVIVWLFSALGAGSRFLRMCP